MDADVFSKLANLPENLQIVIGCGYLAYLISYVGIRHSHKPVDAVFLTITFGIVAGLTLSRIQDYSFSSKLSLAFVASVSSGVLWRTIGRKLVRGAFRRIGYSSADDTGSAWDHIQEETKAQPIQLTVETADGWQYFCTDTTKLKGLPFNPYVLGANGDVVMYADHTQGPTDKEASPKEDLFDPVFGANATYLPASQIRRVMIRYSPTSSKAGVVKRAARAVVVACSKLRRRETVAELDA